MKWFEAPRALQCAARGITVGFMMNAKFRISRGTTLSFDYTEHSVEQIPQLKTHSSKLGTMVACSRWSERITTWQEVYANNNVAVFRGFGWGSSLNREGRDRSYVCLVGWSEMREFCWTGSTVGTDATMRQATVRSKGKPFLQDLLDFYLSPLFSIALPTQENALFLCEAAIPRSVSSREDTIRKPIYGRLVTNLYIHSHIPYHLLPYPISL
jgi:hypothetical protein